MYNLHGFLVSSAHNWYNLGCFAMKECKLMVKKGTREGQIFCYVNRYLNPEEGSVT